MVTIRVGLNAGWGSLNQPEGDIYTPFGIIYNGSDNLSYVSWSQQALYDVYPFSILYTTSPHDALLINPLFLIIGKLSAFFSLHPLFFMNITGFFFALIAILFLFLSCRYMGMSDQWAFIGTALAIFGSGISWIPWILSRVLHRSLPIGGDLFYFDLFPATAFVFYPYNAVGISLSAILLYSILKSEKRLYEEKKYGFLFFTFISGAMLTSVRPYEPIAFLFCYSVLCISLLIFSKEKHLVYSRFIICMVLTVSIVPLEIYNYWVSKQNIWNNFAGQSLSLFPGRLTWLLGFGLFFPMAIFGIYLTIKNKNKNLYFLSIWSAFVFSLLILFKSGMTKLSSSGFIALAILSAYTLNHLFTWISESRHYWIKKSKILVTAIVIASVSLSSFIAFIFIRAPVIDPEIIKAAGVIRELSPKAIPSVLTDIDTGSLLPGIAGMRVYAGHWALTDDWNRKKDVLSNAGFLAINEKKSIEVNTISYNFINLLNEARFDFALIRKNHLIFAVNMANFQKNIVYNGKRWVVVKIKSL